VPANLATCQRHGNSRPFETIMRRPVVSVDQLRRGMGGPSLTVIARSPCDEAIHTSCADRWIASLRSQ
jgi:hypothetical protein